MAIIENDDDSSLKDSIHGPGQNGNASGAVGEDDESSCGSSLSDSFRLDYLSGVMGAGLGGGGLTRGPSGTMNRPLGVGGPGGPGVAPQKMTASNLAVLNLTEENRGWTTMDSVHSRASDISGALFGNHGEKDSIHGNPLNPTNVCYNNNSFNASGDFDDSCASFASFGGSESTDDSENLEVQRSQFTRLQEDMPGPSAATRRMLLMKSSSMRLKRGPSFRGSLQLIDERKTEEL